MTAALRIANTGSDLELHMHTVHIGLVFLTSNVLSSFKALGSARRQTVKHAAQFDMLTQVAGPGHQLSLSSMMTAAITAGEGAAGKLCMWSSQRSPGCVPACIQSQPKSFLWCSPNEGVLAVACPRRAQAVCYSLPGSIETWT